MTPAYTSSPDVRSVRSPKTAAWSAGFTLIELLSVIGIIAILLGIVLSAIETVHRYSRKAVAQIEVRAIEDAWKRYFDHYNRWPTNTSGIAGYLSGLSSPDIYHTYRINVAMGRALEGRVDHDGDAASLNPDGIHLMEFTRHGTMTPDLRAPVNPWHRGSKLEPGEDIANDADSKFFYYVRFDVNANNQVSTKEIPGLSDEAKGEDDRVSRSVIVWTYNPNDPEDFISSWSR